MDLASHDKSPAAALCWGNHNKHVHTHNLGECTMHEEGRTENSYGKIYENYVDK